jgi:TrmH family RNA methyltransferase
MRPSSQIRIVLVRPKFSVNVGYVSRVMSNMGADHLLLIDPRCKMDQRALEGAAGGQGPLRSVTIFSSWEEFYKHEGEGYRIALTGKLVGPSGFRTFNEALTEVSQAEAIAKPLYLFFGPEDLGFNNEDLELMHFACELPTFGNFKSMNLSHAVLVALFMMNSQGGLIGPNNVEVGPSTGPLDFPHTLLERWLSTLGFDLSNRKVSASTKLSRWLLRAVPTTEELKLLTDLLHQNIRKLEQK